MNDFGLLIAQYNATLPSVTDAEFNELQVDSKGRLIISGRFIGDETSVFGTDAGVQIFAVRRDADSTIATADGKYAPLQLDENGRLKVVADIEVANGHEKAEDSVHANEDIGSYILAVRSDARPTNANTSATGDYASFFVNANGELYIHDTDALAKLTEIDTVLDNILTDTNAMVVDLAAIEAELLAQGVTLDSILTDTNAMVVDLAAIEAELLDQGTTLDSILSDTSSIDTEIQSLTHVEDTAHASGHVGTMPLAVRRDADTSLVNADGDYAPLQVDSIGRLKIAGAVTMTPEGSEQYTVTDALAAAGDGLEVITAAATPWITVASFAHADGTAYLYGWQWACDQNATARVISDDTTNIIVYKVGVNSSAKPGESEHWTVDGRIEIPGTAALVVKLQIKKRSVPGGNANGTGSMHIRK